MQNPKKVLTFFTMHLQYFLIKAEFFDKERERTREKEREREREREREIRRSILHDCVFLLKVEY